MDRFTKTFDQLNAGIKYPKGFKTQSRTHGLFLMIMYGRKFYLEDRNSSKQATTKSTTNKEVDYTLGARLCSNGEVDLFLKANQNL